jgi:predicted lipoprotein with Yx(FWY)xxD motif
VIRSPRVTATVDLPTKRSDTTRSSKPITFLARAAVIPLTGRALVGGTQVANAGTAHPAFASESSVTAAWVSHSSKPPTIEVRRTGLGKILVDSSGRTLYLFKEDPQGRSRCSGNCAVNWPPLLTTGRPTAGSGIKASELATTRRSGGKTQVVYNGHPLYRFIGDRKPGSTTGEDLSAFGAFWFVVSPAGNEIR